MKVVSDEETILDLTNQVERLRARYTSAVETLRDIAQMSGKVGSETAAHRLRQLGEPRYLDEDLTDAARAKAGT
jgi:hypothetical protein